MKFFEQQHRLGADDCAIDAKEYQNLSINDYYLWNTYNMKCSDKEQKIEDFAVNNNNLHFKNGYGYTTGCFVDNDTELRVNGKITHDKVKRQLKVRYYVNNPDLSKGVLVPHVETKLIQGDDTSQYKDCAWRLAEKDYDRFVPMIPCLKDNIQNPQNVIPPFAWGGENSRVLMRDANVLKKCGYSFKEKKGWVRS
jgi:hypothetical protein